MLRLLADENFNDDIVREILLREAIEEIVLITECSEQADWNRLVIYLPL